MRAASKSALSNVALIKKGLRQRHAVHLSGVEELSNVALIKKGLRRAYPFRHVLILTLSNVALIKKGLRPAIAVVIEYKLRFQM